MLKKILSAVLALSLVSVIPAAAESKPTETVTFKYGDTEYTREMEKLGRGLTAVRTGGGVFLSWRLLASEASPGYIPAAPSFNVYRDGKLIASVTDSTNYTDTQAGESYSVAPVFKDGSEGEKCAETAVLKNPYIEIPLQKPAPTDVEVTAFDKSGNALTADPNYYVGDASAGDLDGDGEYEIILKWDCNPQDNSLSGVTGNVIIDAYKLDGELLWRIDLGRNIRAGAHYTQFLVYDFDLDGKAELCCKTAPGSTDSNGDYVNLASRDDDVRNGDNSAVFVDAGGRIGSGDEYYTYFESDGTAADTVFYPFSREGYWGHDSGGSIDNWNRVDRYLGTVAYLDGQNPAAVSVRGYYDRTTVAAFTVEDGRLNLAASHDTFDNGGVYGYYGGEFAGQGNHNITAADVDNDGRDEILTGSICFDDDLSVKWSSGRGHGDALHIGDYDPENPGLEYFSVHEGGGFSITESSTGNNGKQADYGMTVYSAATGEELFHTGAGGDTGRGVMGNFGIGGYYQITGSGVYMSEGGTDFSQISARGMAQNFRIFWDGDLYEEQLDGTAVSSWNGSRFANVFNAGMYGCKQINGTKSTPCLSADLFGDWREEMVYPTEDDSSLRIFTTTEPTNYKLTTLMHDPVYRSGVAAEQTAYNQPPHIGFYLSEELFEDRIEYITAEPEKYDYALGEEITGVNVTAHYLSGKTERVYDYEIKNHDPMTEGVQTVTAVFEGFEAEFTINVTPQEVEQIEILSDFDGVFTGRKLELETQIYPSNASDKTTAWASSDPETAYVDENGVVYGIKEGSAVITARAGECTDSFEVTVKEEGSYTQTPSRISLPYLITAWALEDRDCTTGGLCAKVSDQFGIEIAEPAITWETSGSEISVNADSESITVAAGTKNTDFGLYAYCGSAFEMCTVETVNVKRATRYYINEDFTGAPSMTMGDSPQSQTVNGITYALSSRNGGDASTGFVPETDGENTYQVFRAGRFSDQNRNPVMTLDSAPQEFRDSEDYVLSAKLCFPPSSSQYTQTVSFSHGTGMDDRVVISRLSSADFEPGMWIEYSLIRHGGEWYELIRKSGGDIISFEKTDAADLPVNMIDVVSTAAGQKDEQGHNATSKVCIDNLEYYSADKAVLDTEIRLFDEYGAPMSGAAKVSGLIVFPDEDGVIRTELPAGIYTLSYGRAKADIHVSEYLSSFELTQPMKFSSKTDGNIVTLRLPSRRGVYIAGYGDGGVLENIKADSISGEKFYILDFEPDKVFVWQDNMVPEKLGN